MDHIISKGNFAVLITNNREIYFYALGFIYIVYPAFMRFYTINA